MVPLGRLSGAELESVLNRFDGDRNGKVDMREFERQLDELHHRKRHQGSATRRLNGHSPPRGASRVAHASPEAPTVHARPMPVTSARARAHTPAKHGPAARGGTRLRAIDDDECLSYAVGIASFDP